MADSEHRVIYRAVANFKDLYEEIAKANAALKTLRDERSRAGEGGRDTANQSARYDTEVRAAERRAERVTAVARKAATDSVNVEADAAKRRAEVVRVQEEREAQRKIQLAERTQKILEDSETKHRARLLAQARADAADARREAERDAGRVGQGDHDVDRRTDLSRSDQIKTWIEEAYRKAHGGKVDEWVGIADVRDHIGDRATRQEVDQALKAMARSQEARVIPVANSKGLSERDREAAVDIGDQPQHVVGYSYDNPPTRLASADDRASYASHRDDDDIEPTLPPVDPEAERSRLEAARRYAEAKAQQELIDEAHAEAVANADEEHAKALHAAGRQQADADEAHAHAVEETVAHQQQPMAPPRSEPDHAAGARDEQGRLTDWEGYQEYHKRYGTYGGNAKDSPRGQALADYHLAGHELGNQLQRGEEISPDRSEEDIARARAMNEQIHEAFDAEGGKLKEDLKLYRGRYSRPDNAYPTTPGSLIDDPTFQSTSMREGAARTFSAGWEYENARRQMLEINARRGQEGMAMEGDESVEAEVLLRRGRYRVTGSHVDDEGIERIQADHLTEEEFRQALLEQTRVLAESQAKPDRGRATDRDREPAVEAAARRQPAERGRAVPDPQDIDLRRIRNAQEKRDADHSVALKQYKKFLDEQAKVEAAARKKSVEDALRLNQRHPEQIDQARKDAYAEEKRRNTEREQAAKVAAAAQAKRDQDHATAIREQSRLLDQQKKSISDAAEADRKRRQQQVDQALRTQGTHPEQISDARDAAYAEEKQRNAEREKAEKEAAKREQQYNADREAAYKEQERREKALAALREKQDKEQAERQKQYNADREAAYKEQEKRERELAKVRAAEAVAETRRRRQEADDELRRQGTHPEQIESAHGEANRIDKERERQAQELARVQAVRDRDHVRALREVAALRDRDHAEAMRQINEEASRQETRDRDHARAERELASIRNRAHDEALRQIERERVARNRAAEEELRAGRDEVRRLRDREAQRRREREEELRGIRDMDLARRRADEENERRRRRGDDRNLNNLIRQVRNFRNDPSAGPSPAGRRVRNLGRRIRRRPPLPAPTPGPTRRRSTASRVRGVIDAVPQFGDSLNRYQRLIAIIIGAIIALIPLVATLVGVLGALSSAFIAAFAGVAVFALAAVGHFAKLKQAIEDNKKMGVGIADEYKEAARALEDLKKTYSNFLKVTAEPVLAVFTDALRIANTLLPRFTGLVEITSRALQGGLFAVFDRAESGGFKNFLAFVGRAAPSAILAFTKTLLGLLAGLGELAVAFEPFIAFFTNGLVDMAEGFERWAQSLQAGGSRAEGFTEFMNYTATVGPEVATVLKQLGMALIDLGVALAPIGMTLLKIIEYLSRFVQAIPTPVLTVTIGLIIGLWSAFRLLLGIALIINLLQRLWAVIRFFYGLGLITRFIAAFNAALIAYRAATTAAAAATALLRIAMLSLLAATVVGIVLAGIGLLISAFVSSTNDATEASQKFAAAQDSLAAALEAANGKIDDNVKKTAIKNLQDSGVLDIASQAGIAPTDLVDAYLGSEEDFNKVKETLERRKKEIESRQKVFEAAEGSGRGIQGGAKGKLSTADQAELDAVNKALESTGKLRQGYLDEVSARAQRDAAIYANVGNIHGEAEAIEVLRAKTKELIEQQDSPTDKAVDAYKKYQEAGKKYVEAVEAQKRAVVDTARSIEDAARRQADSETAVSRAQQNAKRSQEALTQAREDAAQKIIDMRRVLRDLPLDEEAARIALQRAQEAEVRSRNAPGSTGLDRREALLELKRAQNALTDLLADNPKKATDAEKTIDKGVEGSDAVQDAIAAAQQALLDQQRAVEDNKRAQEDYKRAVDDAKKANREANEALAESLTALQEATIQADGYAASLGLTLGTLGQLKDKLDQMTQAGAYNIQLSVDTGDALTQINEVAVALLAMNILKNNPNMSVPDAYAQAREELKGFTPATKPNPKAGQSRAGGLAAGGAVEGSGPGTVDSVPTMLAPGEHVWTAAEVVAVGGHTMLKAIRDAALGRKAQASRAPGADRLAAELFKVAGVYGRPAVATFDPASMYGSLNAAAMARPNVPVSATAGVSVTNNSVRGGFSVGDVTINNPVREPSGASLYRTVRRFAYDHEK